MGLFTHFVPQAGTTPDQLSPALRRLISALESRNLLDSADGINQTADQAAPDTLPVIESTRREVVFIDAGLPDYQVLVEAVDPAAEVHLVEAGIDGIVFMSETLAGQSGIDAIHVLGHGSSGAARLGNATLTPDNLDAYADALATIGNALTEDGDLLLYGCSIGADGAFIERLAELTGADLAASTNPTGAAALGGDWVLEWETGAIEASAFSGAEQYAFTLANETLDFSNDTVTAHVTATHPTTGFGTIYFRIVENADSTGTARDLLTDAATGEVDDSYDDFYYFGESGKYLVIYTDGREISFTSVDFGSSGDTAYTSLTAYAYKDGTLLGSQTVSQVFPATPDATKIFTAQFTDAIFNDVDEIRLQGLSNYGSEYANAVLDNLVIGDPIPANEAPVIGGAAATSTINDNATIIPFSPLSFTDGDNDGGTIAITYVAANGTLSGTGLTGTAGNYTLSGDNPAELTSRLQALVFTPTENQVAPGNTVQTLFTLTPNDGKVNGSANNSTQVTATSVNDAPTEIVLSDATVLHSEGSSNVVVGSLSTTDPDPGDSFTYALVAGSGDTSNALFTIAGTNLRANDPTAMTPGTYSVRIRTTDAGSATYEKDFTITVNDDVAPTVTDANISISGATGTDGAFRIGDTVTATWNNTGSGDNNSDISSVTTDFSAFGGGAAVVASNSSGTWTATHTIVAGAIDATNRNVSVTATDNAGNSSTTADTTNATVDNVAPTVTDANISISGATGTGGAFRIGDTVTATWNNTGSGDNNSDISSVTTDFSAFGGGVAVVASNSYGTWTATHTIVAGAIDATNRNVSVTATDNAGNSSTTADTTNATVDNESPGTPTGTLAVDENSANSTSVGTVTGGGDDGVSYSLSDNAGGRFAINASTGAVTVADGSLLDYESNASHDITVCATDNAGNTTEATLTVTVNDVNDMPTVNLDADNSSGAGGNNYATSFSAAGAAVTIADADAILADEDAGDQIESLTVTLTNRPDGGAESLSLDTTAITAAAANSLSVSYNAGTGILLISGTAPPRSIKPSCAVSSTLTAPPLPTSPPAIAPLPLLPMTELVTPPPPPAPSRWSPLRWWTWVATAAVPTSSGATPRVTARCYWPARPLSMNPMAIT